MVALVEEYETEEEDVEEAIESDHEDKVELTMPDHGTSLVVQRSLKIRAAASEENWLRSNVFHTKCTSKTRFVWLLFDSFHGRAIRNQQNLFPKFLLLP